MKNCLLFLTRSFLTVVITFGFTNTNFGQAPDLGIAANFILFTPVGAVGSTGISHIAGNIGSDDGAITGFEGMSVVIFNANAVTEQCSNDVLAAYNQLNNTTPTLFPMPVLGNGQILYPGVYSIPQAASLNGDLTFDAQGDPNAIFIIQVEGAFTTSASSSIILANGAASWNIYWKVNGAVSTAAGTTMMGTIIANNGAISMGIDTRFEGRALSTTGAISVYGVWLYGPGTIPLPITLINFSATKTEARTINLTWTTANEFSLINFEIERSVDGRNFYKVGSMDATNTSIIKKYTLTDFAPLRGINFYRLKTRDIDGSFKYASIVKVNIEDDQNFSVYPNPVKDRMVTIRMNGEKMDNYNVALYSSNGNKVMASTKISADNVVNIPLSKDLPSGVYWLQITTVGKYKKVIPMLVE